MRLFPIISLLLLIQKCESDPNQKMPLQLAPLLAPGLLKEKHPDNLAFRPISILVDYSNMEKENNISNEQQSLIKKVLMPRMVELLRSILKVNGPKTIALSGDECNKEVTIPEAMIKTPVTADLLIFIKSFDQPQSGFIAVAAPCVLNEHNRRPSVGIVIFNGAQLKMTFDKVDYYFYSALHETMHVLVMDPLLYPHYVDGKKVVQEKGGIMYLSTPRLVKHAQEYFNCPTLEGVPLENEGGIESAGTHFEKVTLGNELMTAMLTEGATFSAFSLSLLADSGWYEVDQGQAERLTWGFRRGCDFAKAACPRGPEVCPTLGELSCTADHLGFNECQPNIFAPGCNLREYSRNAMCTDLSNEAAAIRILPEFDQRGADSRCFMAGSGAKKPVCFNVVCESPKTLAFTVKDKKHVCTAAEAKVATAAGEVICPDPEVVCRTVVKACPNGCSGKGKCLENGKCRCKYAFDGADCSVAKACNDKTLICENKAPNTSGPAKRALPATTNNVQTTKEETIESMGQLEKLSEKLKNRFSSFFKKSNRLLNTSPVSALKTAQRKRRSSIGVIPYKVSKLSEKFSVTENMV